MHVSYKHTSKENKTERKDKEGTKRKAERRVEAVGGGRRRRNVRKRKNRKKGKRRKERNRKKNARELKKRRVMAKEREGQEGIDSERTRASRKKQITNNRTKKGYLQHARE